MTTPEHPPNSIKQAPPGWDQRIRMSIFSPSYFHNKDNTAPLRYSKKRDEMSNDYAASVVTPVLWTAQQLIDHILKGHAYAVGNYKGNWRRVKHKDADSVMQIDLIEASIIGADFENGSTTVAHLADLDIAKYFCLIHETASHTEADPRCRGVSILDQPITDANEYKRLVLRWLYFLAGELGGHKADEGTAEGGRMFYGCDGAEHVADPAARLPLAFLRSLPLTPEELAVEEWKNRPALPPREKPKTDGARSRQDNYVAKIVDGILADAEAVTKERYKPFRAASLKLCALHLAGVLDDWRYIAENLGRRMQQSESEIQRLIDGAPAAATPWELPDFNQQATAKRPRTINAQRPLVEQQSTIVDREETAFDNSTLYRRGLWTVWSPKAVLVDRWRCEAGLQRFTIDQLVAANPALNRDTVEDAVKAALEDDCVSEIELSGDFRGLVVEEKANPLKSADITKTAPRPRVFEMTWSKGYNTIRNTEGSNWDRFFARAYKLMDLPEPKALSSQQCLRTNKLDADTSRAIADITTAASQSDAGAALRKKNEDVVMLRLGKILTRAENDTLPIVYDDVPLNVPELRTLMIDNLIAAVPGDHANAEFVWVTGVMKDSVGNIKKRSTRVRSSDKPALVSVKINGRCKNPHRAVREACHLENGSPFAVVYANGKEDSYSKETDMRDVVQVLINVGKTYWIEEASSPDAGTSEPHKPATTTTRKLPPSLRRSREELQACAEVRRALEAALIVFGWQPIYGIYGGWQRDDQKIGLTFDELVRGALLCREQAEAVLELRRLAEVEF